MLRKFSGMQLAMLSVENQFFSLQEPTMLQSKSAQILSWRKRELPQLANSPAASVRWTFGDMEDMLRAQIAVMTQRAGVAETRERD
jgi:hypothetical protein